MVPDVAWCCWCSVRKSPDFSLHKTSSSLHHEFSATCQSVYKDPFSSPFASFSCYLRALGCPASMSPVMGGTAAAAQSVGASRAKPIHTRSKKITRIWHKETRGSHGGWHLKGAAVCTCLPHIALGWCPLSLMRIRTCTRALTQPATRAAELM